MTSSSELDILARTLWGEARGEGLRGMQAVATVILNRARNPRWWGHDVRSVCLAKYQFSCWLPKPEGELPSVQGVTVTDPSFELARSIAAGALGKLVDATCGADTYANLHVSSPAWARGKTPCAIIGMHSFFRLELRAPAVESPADKLNDLELEGTSKQQS